MAEKDMAMLTRVRDEQRAAKARLRRAALKKLRRNTDGPFNWIEVTPITPWSPQA